MYPLMLIKMVALIPAEVHLICVCVCVNVIMCCQVIFYLLRRLLLLFVVFCLSQLIGDQCGRFTCSSVVHLPLLYVFSIHS